MDAIREFISNWAMIIVAILGVIAAWDKASRQIRSWWGEINLYRRMRVVEGRLDEHEHDRLIHK